MTPPLQLQVCRGHRFASTLVVAEHNSSEVSASTLAAVTAATKIGGDVSNMHSAVCGRVLVSVKKKNAVLLCFQATVLIFVSVLPCR